LPHHIGLKINRILDEIRRGKKRASKAKYLSSERRKMNLEEDSGNAVVKAFKFYKKALLICKKVQ
jgi:hypothetical protein